MAASLLLRRTMAKEVEKSLKTAATPSSYFDFVVGWRKVGLLSRQVHDSNPEYFWQMYWHHQSVEYVYTRHGWPVAAEYHRQVMELWSQDFLDPSSRVDDYEFSRGNVQGALHQASYLLAVNKLGGKGSLGGGNGSGKGGGGVPGTASKASADDTFCAEHQLWYPKSAGHAWSWLTKTGSCGVAKAKAGK
jgi:hypothetical protein